MLGFSCADLIVVKISRGGFTENCGVSAGHSQLLVFDGLNFRGQMNSISIFTLQISLSFRCTLLPLEVFLNASPLHCLCTTFACICVNLTFVMTDVFYKRGCFSFYGYEHSPTKVEIHSFGVCRF